MSELTVIENYQDHPVEFRRSDGYLNLTALCQEFGLRPNDFLALRSTKRSLAAWAKRLSALPETLVVVALSVGNGARATWLRPKARGRRSPMVDDDFGCWCDDTIKQINDGDIMSILVR